MSKFNTSRYCWSWRSCFTVVKHNKRKVKKQKNLQSSQEKLSPNDHACNGLLHKVDENSNILHDVNLSSKKIKSNTYNMKNEASLNKNDNDITNDHNTQTTIDDNNSKIVNQKPLSTIRTKPLDVIVEDSNEDNYDEFDEITQFVRLCCDSKLMNDCNDLYTRLSDLCTTHHIIIQFNDNVYLLQQFKRQIGKLKIKIDDIKRAGNELPRHAELLEARYSTLLATIESLSLLLKVGQISSFASFINHLIFSIEQRMEQLNKFIQLSSSINLRQLRQDLNDEDFLSFRSAISSYEHLLTIPS